MTISIGLTACSNQQAPKNASAETKDSQTHLSHNSLADNLAHKDIIILEEQHIVAREFGYLIGTLLGIYLDLQESLAKSDTVAANNAAKEIIFILDLIPELNADTVAIKAWVNHKTGYKKNMIAFLHVESLQDKRSYFSHFSEILYCTIKSFKMDLGDIHIAYCPMAFDNKGAYWLTDSHKIRNPYFGQEMLTCGSIIEHIP